MDPYPLYRLVTALSGPALRLLLIKRQRRGKEDAARLGERRGEDDTPRPEGPLLWCHGASVGECLALLPLVERLRRDQPQVT
ncbi:MAG: glycosyltransferase N-terminal domain-containing protein, partial [Rhodospirillaceae bacterium]